MISVWYGESFCIPRGWTGVSLPLISTCGSWPTEKFRSLILSDTSNIRSIMGGKSKKLIYGFKLRKGLSVAGRLVRKDAPFRNSVVIFAHNNDKRKKNVFSGREFKLRFRVQALACAWL